MRDRPLDDEHAAGDRGVRPGPAAQRHDRTGRRRRRGAHACRQDRASGWRAWRRNLARARHLWPDWRRDRSDAAVLARAARNRPSAHPHRRLERQLRGRPPQRASEASSRHHTDRRRHATRWTISWPPPAPRRRQRGAGAVQPLSRPTGFRSTKHVADVRALGVPVIVDSPSPRLDRTLASVLSWSKCNDWQLAYVGGPVDGRRALRCGDPAVRRGRRSGGGERAVSPVLVVPADDRVPFRDGPPALPGLSARVRGDTMMGAIAAWVDAGTVAARGAGARRGRWLGQISSGADLEPAAERSLTGPAPRPVVVRPLEIGEPDRIRP